METNSFGHVSLLKAVVLCLAIQWQRKPLAIMCLQVSRDVLKAQADADSTMATTTTCSSPFRMTS